MSMSMTALVRRELLFEKIIIFTKTMTTGQTTDTFDIIVSAVWDCGPKLSNPVLLFVMGLLNLK